jgi:hypothetical protein
MLSKLFHSLLITSLEQIDWLKSAVSSLSVNKSQILEYMDSTYSYRRKSIKSMASNNFDAINNTWPRLVDFNKGHLVS